MFNSKINVISNKRKKDSQEKETLKYTKDVSSIIASLPLKVIKSIKGKRFRTNMIYKQVGVYQGLMHDYSIL